jgi:hypothetical protein
VEDRQMKMRMRMSEETGRKMKEMRPNLWKIASGGDGREM